MGHDIALGINNGHLVFASCGGEVVGPTEVTDGRWHHVAAVLSNGNIAGFYVDGALEMTAASLPVIDVISTGFFTIGGLLDNVNNASTTYNYVGLIDEIQVYARALSLEEIRTIYQAAHAGVCRP